jgi:caffeoyl-CoA O-methyltransferase
MRKIKPETTFITDPNVERYAESFSRDSELLKKLIKETEQSLEFSDMLCGPLVGGMLQMLVGLLEPEKILEIGTFTGYSAIKMMEAAPKDSHLFTVDLNERYLKIAEKYFQKSAFADRIHVIRKLAKDAMIEFDNESFGLIFVDADKINYPFYFEQSVALLKSGGILMMDNVLWGGGVVQPSDDKSRAIHESNLLAFEDERVENLLLPVRDGVHICRKR